MHILMHHLFYIKKKSRVVHYTHSPTLEGEPGVLCMPASEWIEITGVECAMYVCIIGS